MTISKVQSGIINVGDMVIDSYTNSAAKQVYLRQDKGDFKGLEPGKKICISGAIPYQSIAMYLGSLTDIEICTFDGVVCVSNTDSPVGYVMAVYGGKNIKIHDFKLSAPTKFQIHLLTIARDGDFQPCNFEVYDNEICDGGFAGIALKSDDYNKSVMDNISIHDNYIHDTGSEGMYIGHFNNDGKQHLLTNLRVYRNRVIRSGSEGLQFGCLGDGCVIENNVVISSAMRWRNNAPFNQRYQDGALQVGAVSGKVVVRNNMVIGSANQTVYIIPQNNDVLCSGSIEFYNNLVAGTRSTHMYIGNSEGPLKIANKQVIKVGHNIFLRGLWSYNEAYKEAVNKDAHIVVGNTANPVLIHDNRHDSSFSRLVYQATPSVNVTEFDNVVDDEIEMPKFINSGFPDDFDYRDIEVWVDKYGDYTTVNPGKPVVYKAGKYVLHKGQTYRAVNNNSMEPPNGNWELKQF